MTNRLAVLIAGPAIAGAIIGGAALGFAGPASASSHIVDDTPTFGYNDQPWPTSTSTGSFNSPTTYADPAPEVLPYGVWVNLH